MGFDEWLDAFEQALAQPKGSEERIRVTGLLFELWAEHGLHLRTGDYRSLGMAAQDLLQRVKSRDEDYGDPWQGGK